MKKMSRYPFQGKKLRLARTFHGLTLAELGQRVSASRQYMQKLESDLDSSPSNEMLLALAEILQVGTDFFFDPGVAEIIEEECHFRRLKTTPSNLRNRALSYGTIFNLILSYLDNYLEFPHINIPSIRVITREDIERAAEKCRTYWGLGLDAPVANMTRTLELNGCVITTFKGVSEKIDAFSYFNSRPIIVRSLDKGSTSRARFDLAHECGHLVMHNEVETGNIETEEQANQFASAFLLPRSAFLHEFPKSNPLKWRALFNFKKRWGVSIQAIIRRAYDLRLISAVQYRNANVYISRNGWRHGEPPESEPLAEAVEILPVAFDFIYEKYKITPANIAEKLHLNCDIINQFGIICDESRKSPDDSNLLFFREHMMKRRNLRN